MLRIVNIVNVYVCLMSYIHIIYFVVIYTSLCSIENSIALVNDTLWPFILFTTNNHLWFIGYYRNAERNNRIPCPNNCGHSYTGAYRKKNLKRHLIFECGVEPQFQCSFCQKPFRHKSSMKSHILLIHKSFMN